jgi:benzoate/toluate 1,2-dioxygenase reductase component
MTFQIALNFEDGVTRFIQCRPNELVSDASYRQRINIPLDCRDGVCGTCKSFCESGDYELGDYVPDEAMTEDEEEAGYVLTCQMTPKSDLIIRIPATSDVAKTSVSTYEGELAANERLSDTALAFSIKLDNRSSLGFLPGQYVNVQVPGTDQARSFSFSSGPGEDEVAFLIRNTTYGVLTTYLRERAKVGDKISFNGPLGSFYLRKIERPVLFLAGGTGLAPFLSMLNKIEQGGGAEHPIHLIFGVTNDADLVEVEKMEGYAQRLSNFTFTTVVAAEESAHPNKGFVTHHMKPEYLNDGFVDIYLCGPPPMVDAVRKYLADQGIEPASFYYEKFSGSGVVSEIGESHVKAVDSDQAFDTRMALELGAAQLALGKLSVEQLGEYRRLAEATGQFIKDGHFSDPAGFREANSAFHLFPIEATGNDVLLEAYRKLLVQEYMGQVLTPSVDVVGDITQDHINIVDAFERGDFEALRRIITEHTDHAKATMRAGIEKPGG